MPRLQLPVYVDPGELEIFCNIVQVDGSELKLTASVDTGAEVSLFPADLMNMVNYRLADESTITIVQAGSAAQSFEARVAFMGIALEDEQGRTTNQFEIPVWFADTETPLLGFAGVLDCAVLHIDMPARTGWIEIDA